MGLQASRILNSVHPWLKIRLEWLGEVATIFGSSQTLLSGNRTAVEQLELYNSQTTRPAAFPGCSQHQYGFAADAQWRRATHISSKGRGILLSQNETDRFMASAAHHVNLTTVAQDPGHLQIYPGNQFKNWAVGRGFCPLIPPHPRDNFGIVPGGFFTGLGNDLVDFLSGNFIPGSAF